MAECDCKILPYFRAGGFYNGAEIVYCPAHGMGPELRKALVVLLGVALAPPYTHSLTEQKEAIAQAELIVEQTKETHG